MQSLGRATPPRRDLVRRDLARRDPAPSRWSYRMQRLWLTPLFRVLFRVGLPAFVLAMSAGIYLSDPDRRDDFAAVFDDLKVKFEERPEFRVTFLSVEGASPELADAVRAKLAIRLPASSFDLDLDAARLKAEGLDAVAKADLRVRSGGILQVMVTERAPVLIWRSATGLTMIDATGHRVAGLAERGDRPDLPLVAGEGADLTAPEALAILEAAAPLTPRLRGLVRMGDRRWDIVLDRDQRIELPEENPVTAVERLLALDQAEDILARDILTVDLRNDHRPVLRLAPAALDALRGIDPAKPSPTQSSESKL